eukprot:1159761-Pelagomonas_calceolata.AAC.6
MQLGLQHDLLLQLQQHQHQHQWQAPGHTTNGPQVHASSQGQHSHDNLQESVSPSLSGFGSRSQGEESTLPGSSSQHRGFSERDPIIFVGNDWPTGLLPLWLKTYAEMAQQQQRQQQPQDLQQQGQQQQEPSVDTHLQPQQQQQQQPPPLHQPRQRRRRRQSSASSSGIRGHTEQTQQAQQHTSLQHSQQSDLQHHAHTQQQHQGRNTTASQNAARPQTHSPHARFPGPLEGHPDSLAAFQTYLGTQLQSRTHFVCAIHNFAYQV